MGQLTTQPPLPLTPQRLELIKALMKGISSSPVTERHMTEGSRHFVPIESDEGLERSAVAGAAAIEKLIADRNNLRNLLATHERELAASRAAQEDLKRQLGILHQRYIELGKRVVAQLQQFDGAMREAMAERPAATNGINGHGHGPLPLEP